MNDALFQQLASLFFSTRQIIRAKLPDGKADPNAWLRFQTMRYIEDSDGPTMQEVAAYLRIKAPSATSLVRHLVAQGKVRRTTGKDKRFTRLLLTPRGKKILVECQRRSNDTLKEVFADFKPADVRELVRILAHLQHLHGDAKGKRGGHFTQK